MWLIGTPSSSSGSPGLCWPRLQSSPNGGHMGSGVEAPTPLYGNTQGVNCQPKLLVHLHWTQFIHKSDLLRQHQFLFPVLLLSPTKPHQSSLGHRWFTASHLFLSPKFHSWSQIKTFPHSELRKQSFRLGLPFFWTFSESVSPTQTQARTNVRKDVSALLSSIFFYISGIWFF